MRLRVLVYTCTRGCSLITVCEVAVTKCQMITVRVCTVREHHAWIQVYKHQVEETNFNSFFLLWHLFCCLQCFDAVGWVGRQEGHPAHKKNIGGWWRWALVTSLDRVAPIRMVGVSASVNLSLHRKVQKFYSGTGSPGWSRKKGRQMVVVVVMVGFSTFGFIAQCVVLQHCWMRGRTLSLQQTCSNHPCVCTSIGASDYHLACLL